jgi:hypothetical protein
MRFSSEGGRSTIATQAGGSNDPNQWLRKTKKPRAVKRAAFLEENQIT